MTEAPSPSGIFDSPGCKISCFVGNNAGEASAMVTLVVGGRDARQQEFDRSPPLSLAGKSPEYREVWTAVRGGRGLIVFVAFWPKQDASLEAEVRSAYQLMLSSVQFTAPAEQGSYNNNDLGISFNYPSGWIEGASEPLWICNNCVVFGPPNADPALGVFVFDMIAPPRGQEVSGLAGNNAIGFTNQAELTVGGRTAQQVEFDRTPPPPLAETRPLYREIWTAVPGGRGLIVIAGFWPKQDASLEAQVRSAYQLMLSSVQFTAPAASPTAPTPSVTLPGTGVGDGASRSRRELITLMAALLAVSGACMSFAGFSSLRKR